MDSVFYENLQRSAGASINVMAEIQGGLPVGLEKIQRHFGERVTLEVVDVRDREHPTRHIGWQHLEILKSEGNHENIKRRLETELERQRPNIGEAAYQHARGNPPGTIGNGRGYDRELQTNESGRGISAGNHEKGLLAPYPLQVEKG